MFLNQNTDPRDHSTCALYYNEQEKWLQAIWRGYVDPLEAQRGAEAYLQHAVQTPCALLLNDNSQLTGPWFDSLEWLANTWLPQAQRLGLRYIAHIVQANTQHDILTARLPLALPFELQIFQQREEACAWLRQVREALPNGLATNQATQLPASKRLY